MAERLFQLTAARRRLGRADGVSLHAPPYFNSQPREGGWLHLMAVCWRKQRFQLTAARRRLAPRPTPAPPHHDFNSQPREGGWLAAMSFFSCPPPHFNSQPREGGWRGKNPAHQPAEYFNSQPREGGWLDNFINTPMRGAISTHSRAKAAGLSYALLGGAADISTHSRAKAAGTARKNRKKTTRFQLTAARRRLATT